MDISNLHFEIIGDGPRRRLTVTGHRIPIGLEAPVTFSDLIGLGLWCTREATRIMSNPPLTDEEGT